MGKENTCLGMTNLRSALETPESFFQPLPTVILTARDVEALTVSMSVNFGTEADTRLVGTNLGAKLELSGRTTTIPVINMGPVSLMYVDPRRQEFMALGENLGRLAEGLLPDIVGTLTSKKSGGVCETAIRQIEAETGKRPGRVVFVNSRDREEIRAIAGDQPVVVYQPITIKPGENKYLTVKAEDVIKLRGDGRLVIIDDVNSRGDSRMAARICRAMVRGNKVPQAILHDLAQGIVLSEAAMQAIEAGIDPSGKEEAELQNMTRLARRKELLSTLGTDKDIVENLAGNKQAYTAAVMTQVGAQELGNEDLQKLALRVAEIEKGIPEVWEICLAQEYGKEPGLPAGVKVLFEIPVIVNS